MAQAGAPPWGLSKGVGGVIFSAQALGEGGANTSGHIPIPPGWESSPATHSVVEKKIITMKMIVKVVLGVGSHKNCDLGNILIRLFQLNFL